MRRVYDQQMNSVRVSANGGIEPQGEAKLVVRISQGRDRYCSYVCSQCGLQFDVTEGEEFVHKCYGHGPAEYS